MTLDEQFTDIRDRYLACFRDKFGDAWHLAALERFLHLHALRDLSVLRVWDARDTDEYLLLKKWVEDMVTASVKVKEGQ